MKSGNKINVKIHVCCFTGIVLIYISDIDECRGRLNNCAFRCVNIPGSFTCICPMGYSLAPDGIHCQGNMILS